MTPEEEGSDGNQFEDATTAKKGSQVADAPLTPELLRKMDAYWRAANYLSVGQIYLYDNPLLREPLKLEHVKPQLATGGQRRGTSLSMST